MKSLIVSIVIIVSLIIFFTMFDCMEFNRYNEAQTVQSESPGVNLESISVTKTDVKPLTETKQDIKVKPIKNKPVAETKLAPETKTVVETKLAPETKTVVETKLMDKTEPVAEDKGVTDSPKTVVESTLETDAKSNERMHALNKDSAPAAVPILALDEAQALNESLIEEIDQDRYSQRHLYFRELFLHTKRLRTDGPITNTTNIQQTANWHFVYPQNPLSEKTVAEKQTDCFSVKSSTPLEYRFILPLHENRIYCYTLGCRAKGRGSITLAATDSEIKKEFIFDSNCFKYVSLELGDGAFFSKTIIPSISFQGDLQIESVVLYQNVVNENWTVCRGIIEEISNVPDINKSDYPDCFYTAIFATMDIIDGNPIPEKIQLLIPAFMEHKIDHLSKIMKKGNWELAIRPFSLATEHEQSIEQVDELESYEYTPYILVDAFRSSVPEFPANGIPILQGEKYVSPYDTPLNPPMKAKYKNDSEKIIAQEQKKLEEIIARVDNADAINSAFQQSWDEIQKKYEIMPGNNLIWAKEQNSFFALPEKWNFIHTQKISQHNIEALAELNKFLRFHGVQFIIQVTTVR